MSQDLFRKVALDKLSSPEQLDQLISVTTPRAWFALLAIACILATSVLWGIFGSISTKVAGQGVIAQSYGINNIVSRSSGRITDIRVEAGDPVKKGDVLARIDQPQLVEQINHLKKELSQYGTARAAKAAEIEYKIKELQNELFYSSEVVAQVDGRVVEVKVDKGDIVQPGERLFSLEREGSTIKQEAVLYVPAEEGKSILPGMEALISPSTVKKEEYGYILGRVISVSEYPATSQEMMHTLGNEDLVARLAGQGVPLEIHVDITDDDSTVSGFKWTSTGGPPQKISSGTICGGSVTISKERPIGMVIPALKRDLSIN